MKEYLSLKLLQLRYVVAIADNGLNMTAAADRLFTSQPGVSKQVKQLEEELGLQIFTRHGRSLSGITPVGRDVIASARIVMQEVDSIRAVRRHRRENRSLARRSIG